MAAKLQRQRPKVTVVGATPVGRLLAYRLVRSGYAVVLVDSEPHVAETVAYDLEVAALLDGYESAVFAGDAAWLIAESAVVVMTGEPRAGATVEQLIRHNEPIMVRIAKQAARWAPNAAVVISAEPVEALCHVFVEASGFEPQRVVGAGLLLATVELRAQIAHTRGVDARAIRATVLGSRVGGMVPVLSTIRLEQDAARDLVSRRDLAEIVRTVWGDFGEPDPLRGESAQVAASAELELIVDAIVRGRPEAVPCAAYCGNDEYGCGGLFIGVPARLGPAGVRAIEEVELDADERSPLERSRDNLRELLDAMYGM
jgi:malate dehydrogenase